MAPFKRFHFQQEYPISNYNIPILRFPLSHGGQIKISQNWEEDMNSKFPFIDLKFAFKKLEDNITCVGVFMPSCKDKISEKDHQKWLAFHLPDPLFHTDNSAFNRWVKRYLEGCWEIDDGPRIKISHELELINSITQYKFQAKLFKYIDNRLINYPIAENNEEYTKAILELYRLLIDGMSKECLFRIAEDKEVELDDEDKRLNSLKQILGEEHHPKIHKPLSVLNRKRMLIHGLPSEGIKTYPAFEMFNKDLINVYSSTRNLRIWLEDTFDIEAKSALSYFNSLSIFPKFQKPARPEMKIPLAKRMVGKTIEKVEYGERDFYKEAHEAEGLNIYFTDGTAISIQIGSNSANIASDYEGLSASDFHTDIMLFWANSVTKKSGK